MALVNHANAGGLLKERLPPPWPIVQRVESALGDLDHRYDLNALGIISAMLALPGL